MEASTSSAAPSQPSSDPPKKRTRISGACVLCGIRKSKCNGIRPSCDRCLRLGEACEWPVPKRRGPQPKAARLLQARDAPSTGEGSAAPPEVPRQVSRPPAAEEGLLPVQGLSQDSFADLEAAQYNPISAIGSPVQDPHFARMEEAFDSTEGALVPIPNNASPISPADAPASARPAQTEHMLMMGGSTGLPWLFKRAAASGMGPPGSMAEETHSPAVPQFSGEPRGPSTGPTESLTAKTLGFSEEVLGALMTHYFLYVHTLWPIIFKPSLPVFSTSEVVEYLDPLVFHAMCCSSARTFDHPSDQQKLGGAVPREVEQLFYDAAVNQLRDRILSTEPSNSNPSTCQALVLLALRNHHSGHLSEAWKYIGLASNLVVELGLNRSWSHVFPPPTTEPNVAAWGRGGRPSVSEMEGEERKRIYWVTYSLSAILSAAVGRPVALRAADADIGLPGLDQGDEFELWAARPYPIDQKGKRPAPRLNASKTHCIAGLIAISKLARILEQIVSSIYAVNRGSVFVADEASEATGRAAEIRKGSREMMIGMLARLYGQLKSWKRDLPPYLNIDVDTAQLGMFRPPRDFWLGAWYQSCLVLLFRNFVPTTAEAGRPAPSSPHRICTNAARSINRLFALHASAHGMYKIPPAWSYQLFTSATTHAANATSPDAHLALQSFAGLDECLSWFSTLSKDWPAHGLSQHAYSVLSRGRASREGLELYKRALEQNPSNRTSPTGGDASNPAAALGNGGKEIDTLALAAAAAVDVKDEDMRLGDAATAQGTSAGHGRASGAGADNIDWSSYDLLSDWGAASGAFSGLGGALTNTATSGIELFLPPYGAAGLSTSFAVNGFDALAANAGNVAPRSVFEDINGEAMGRLQSLLDQVGDGGNGNLGGGTWTGEDSGQGMWGLGNGLWPPLSF